MEDLISTNWLFDFYGPLLTERQQQLLTLWCEDDLSLSEIADEEHISKQAVSDSLRTAQNRLRMYEEKLGLYARYSRLTQGLQECLKELENIEDNRVRKVREELTKLLSEEEGENGL